MRYGYALIIFFAALFFSPHISSAAIYVNASSTSGITSTSVTTFPLTVSSCTGSYLLVGIAKSDDEAGRRISTVTYNGTSTAMIVRKENLGGGDGTGAHIYGMASPDLGTHNVVMTLTGTSVGNLVSAVQFCGVTSTGAIASSTGLTLATGNASVGDMLYDVIAQAGVSSPAPAGDGQIIVGSGYSVTTQQGGGTSWKTATSTNANMSWTTGGIYGDLQGHVSVALTALTSSTPPASGSATTTLNTPEQVFTFIMWDIGYAIILIIVVGIAVMLYRAM